MKILRDWRDAKASAVLIAVCFIQHFYQSKGIMLFVPDPIINTTVAQNILLSVEYSCKGIPSIQWEYMSNWRIQSIVGWKAESDFNVTKSYSDRVHRYGNGSIQLLNVGVKDTGYYVVTVTEDIGSTKHGTIILNVHEILYEDVYFVAVFIAFLAAGSAVLICLMWLCNKCVHVSQKKKQSRRDKEMRIKLSSSETRTSARAEEIELRILSD